MDMKWFQELESKTTDKCQVWECANDQVWEVVIEHAGIKYAILLCNSCKVRLIDTL